MIKASHKKWARIIFSGYLNRILKKSFSHFYTVNELPELPSDKAVLVAPNHTSWWDGFFVDYLNRYFFKRNAYVMMLEHELKKHLILSKIGAYSINPGKIEDVNESLDYTKQLLLKRNNLVIFFPEGVLKPFDIKPGTLRKGILKLTENNSGSFSVLPLAFKISFYNERLPEIYVSFGKVINSTALVKDYEYFNNLFIVNIKDVHNASLNRSYQKDIFK